MEGGDLSNEVAGRLLFVFEGTVGRLRPGAEARERGLLRLRRWAAAVRCWEIPQEARAVLWDAAWRWSYRFDVVTHRPAGFAKALEGALDEADVPFTKVWSMSVDELARALARMPDVQAVFFADQSRRFAYGSRGVLVENGLSKGLF